VPRRQEKRGVAVKMPASALPGAFEPEAIAAMSEVFEAACEVLRDAGPPEVVCEIVAGRIIAAARFGQRDQAHLRVAALAGTRSVDAFRRSNPPICPTGVNELCAAFSEEYVLSARQVLGITQSSHPQKGCRSPLRLIRASIASHAARRSRIMHRNSGSISFGRLTGRRTSKYSRSTMSLRSIWSLRARYSQASLSSASLGTTLPTS
jgi:hypothetical protein